MKRVLVRVFRDPHLPLNPVQVWRENQVSGNTGNLLFSDAAVRAVSCDDVEVTCWTTEEMSRRAEEVADRFDHVLIPLANAFRPAYRGRLMGLTDTVRRMAAPVTVLGVGAQSTADYDLEVLAPVDQVARDFAGAVLEHSASIGVRGEFTADYLRSLGFDDVDVIGCPSMFVGGDRVPQPRRLSAITPESPISLALTPDAPVDEEWLAGLVEQHERLTYIPQDRADLELMLWGSGPVGGPRETSWFPSDLDHPLFATRTARLHLDPRAWIADLAGADLAIGTRIHGVIAGILAGTPAHLLVHDSRTRELAEHFGIPHSRIDGGRPFPDLDAVVAAGFDGPSRDHLPRWERFSEFLDTHGLPHAWRPGAVATYDDRLPPPAAPVVVERGRRPGPLEVLAWTEDYHSQQTLRLERQTLRQRDQIKGLRAGARRLRRQVAAAEKQVKESRSQLTSLQERVDTLELETAPLREPLTSLRSRVGALKRRGGSPTAEPGGAGAD